MDHIARRLTTAGRWRFNDTYQGSRLRPPVSGGVHGQCSVTVGRALFRVVTTRLTPVRTGAFSRSSEVVGCST